METRCGDVQKATRMASVNGNLDSLSSGQGRVERYEDKGHNP